MVPRCSCSIVAAAVALFGQRPRWGPQSPPAGPQCPRAGPQSPPAGPGSFMSGKSPATTQALFLTQSRMLKLPMCTKFGNNKCIISQIIQYAAFPSYILEKSAVLQQHWA